MRSPILVLVLLIAAGVAAFALLSKPEDGEPPGPPATPTAASEAETIGRFPRSQFFIEHDRFLPATDPKVMAGSEARFLKPADEVYGVVLAGHARAYPVRMISYYHVVNDQVSGIPIAVTY